MKLKKNSFPYAFIVLCLTWVILMVLVVPVDYDWTLSLRQHRFRALDQFMGRTIFEGEAVGAAILPLLSFFLPWPRIIWHGNMDRHPAFMPGAPPGVHFDQRAELQRDDGSQPQMGCGKGPAGCYIMLMGITRCMTLSHWLSDVLGASGLSWILMHAIYFWMLRVPEQAAYFERYRRYHEGPLVWELRLCVHLLGMVLGGMAVLMGIRAMMLGAHWGFYLLIPTGILSLIFFQKRFMVLHHRVMNGFSFMKNPGLPD